MRLRSGRRTVAADVNRVVLTQVTGGALVIWSWTAEAGTVTHTVD